MKFIFGLIFIILNEIIEFFRKRPIISLLFIFVLWVNSLPLPDENIGTVRQNPQVERSLPNQKALGISGGGNDGFINPASSTTGTGAEGAHDRGADRFQDYDPSPKIPGAGSNGNPSGSGDDDNFNKDIGTKEWENRVCPNPEEIISNPQFWSDVADDREICTDEDDCEDEEIEIEKFPRRRLLAISPTPTGKLDQQNLEKFDFTNKDKKLQPMVFPSREGIKLSMDQRSLRKVVYSHSTELGLSDLGNRISCPVQGDPMKSQRMDCWAITDVNIREAVVKIFEFTTFDNPRIITLEMLPPNCANQRATYFVDLVTGNSVYFRIGGKQDGKLWSLDKFQPDEIIKMIKDPNVKKITDISNYNF